MYCYNETVYVITGDIEYRIKWNPNIGIISKVYPVLHAILLCYERLFERIVPEQLNILFKTQVVLNDEI